MNPFASATELAAAIRAGEVGSRELLEAYLARIDADRDLNAVVTLAAEEALDEAAACDEERARGAIRGPLHGLPITIKDQFETAGLRTTCGAEVWAEHVPERDAEAVRRLRAAGAVVFGKTNLPPLAGDWQTANPLFGRTANPWDRALGPGGSSGGSAAALAAGQTALELGGDIGGSIRNPAHACGVYGHKPSWGLIPHRGTLPAEPGTLSRTDVATAGPLARGVDDLELALGVLAGPDVPDATGYRLELPPPRFERPAELRVAVWTEEEGFPVDAEVRAGVERAARALEDAGARVDREARPSFALADAHRLRRRLVYPIIARGLPPDKLAALVERAASGDDEDPEVDRARLATQLHVEWLAATEEREQMRARWAEFFAGFDVLLCPVSPVPAFPYDDRPQDERTLLVDGREEPYGLLGSWISLAGVSYLPATVAPAGRTAAGLPVGVEVVGAFLHDRTTIAVARVLAETLGGFQPPPGT